MGTSSIFWGNNDRNPLLPDGYEENVEQNVSTVDWKTAKADLSKFITQSRGHSTAEHVIRQAIRANGGAHRMIVNNSAGIRTAQAISTFFSNIEKNGLQTTLYDLGVQYTGRSIEDVFSILINIMAPASETKEDIVARKAIQEALCDIYDYIEEAHMDLTSIDKLPRDLMDLAMKTFLKEYIWATVMKDLESRIEIYMADVQDACEKETELKEIIDAVVDTAYFDCESVLKDDVKDAVYKLTEQCLSILGGIV